MTEQPGLSRAPIGVFDSGVGGLTVLRELRAALPQEDFVYLGDTARLPYGTKSAATVVRYSLQCAAALAARQIRLLVVACNTASASALDALRREYPALPVVGVIEPGARAALECSRTRHIAVIGTEATIEGGAYTAAIHRLDAGVRVTARACSLFVALAEEGWNDGEVAQAVARRYLEPIFGDDNRAAPGGGACDTLVLGCTHFPVLAPAIRAALPDHVRLVDSAVTTAAAVRQLLAAEPKAAQRAAAAPVPVRPVRGRVVFLATDGAARFARVGSSFLHETVAPEAVEVVDL